MKKTVIIIILITSFCRFNSIAQDESNRNMQLMKSSKDTISLNDSNFSFYAVGGWHGHKLSYSIFVSYFKYLYYHDSVRTMMFECPYSMGLLLNRYIETGIKDEFFSVFNYDTEFRTLFTPLREFYISLPDSDKFSIAGVDVNFIRGNPDGICLLKTLQHEELPDSCIKSIIERILNFSIMQSDYLYSDKLMNLILNSFNMNEVSYKKYFGKDYSIFENVVEKYRSSQVHSFVNYENTDSMTYNSREQMIYKNIADVFESGTNIKIAGLFGWGHVFLNKTKRFGTFQIKHGDDYEYYSFIARLNKESDSPAKGSVCAVQIHESNLVFRKALKKIVGKRIFRQMMKQTKRKNTYMFDFSKDSTHKDISENKFQYLLLVR